jgi:hypothetical protein
LSDIGHQDTVMNRLALFRQILQRIRRLEPIPDTG